MRSRSRRDRGDPGTELVPSDPAYAQLARSEWEDFFDRMSRAVAGRIVEVEVVGLDVGDQIAISHLQLTGMSYAPDENTLRLHVEGGASHVSHSIAHPREVYFRLGISGLTMIAVITADGRTELLNLRTPLALPPRLESSSPP